MSGKDTAGDKLVASIQKTKAQTTPGNDATATHNDKPAAVTTAANTAPKKAAAKKTAPKKPDKSKAPAARGSAPTDRSGKKRLIGLFQRGRRVWPD